MSREHVRHALRYVVNGLALGAAILALPEFGAILPPKYLVTVGSVAAVLNTVLSWLRRSEVSNT